MIDWEKIKQKGNPQYKGTQVEPIDLMKDGGMLRDFALGSIIKYAYRNRGSLSQTLDEEDLKKIIHYCEILLPQKG